MQSPSSLFQTNFCECTGSTHIVANWHATFEYRGCYCNSCDVCLILVLQRSKAVLQSTIFASSHLLHYATTYCLPVHELQITNLGCYPQHGKGLIGKARRSTKSPRLLQVAACFSCFGITAPPTVFYIIKPFQTTSNCNCDMYLETDRPTDRQTDRQTLLI